MSDITGEGYAALYQAGILGKQEIRDALGFGGAGPSAAVKYADNPAEIVPIPGTTQQFVPQQVIPQQAAPQGPPVCPIHHDSHFIPAGISKKPGGKAYKSFRGCTERECSWRVDADS
jgi:hypothetical protein